MTWSEIDVTELVSAEEKIIIDVREIDEYITGHIPGAVNLPLSTFVEAFSEVPHAPVVYLVCQAGGRSARACEFISQQDAYSTTQFVNVTGGTGAWILEGHAVVIGSQPD